VSISSTFYEQLLRTQIPKVQKDVFFVLTGSANAKAARETLMKLTPIAGNLKSNDFVVRSGRYTIQKKTLFAVKIHSIITYKQMVKIQTLFKL